MSLRSRFTWTLLLVSPLVALWLYRATRDPWPAQQGIVVPAGEGAHTARVLASTVAIVNRSHAQGRPIARGAFSKAHGCLRADVSVPELEPRLRHGVFARAAQYEAWVRFSNGAQRPQSDQQRDARGVALKLMGVPGEKLLASERDADTQDFLLASADRFFVADVAAYQQLLDEHGRGSRYGWFLDGWTWKPWRWRVRELYLSARWRTAPASLLQTQYHSVTPYRLGPEQIVKYSLRPCERKRPPRRDRTESMLREGLKEELSLGGGCFELLVQLQVAGRNMPVEDATVRWSERDSPFVSVARVTIPNQQFDTPAQERLCEDLSFTPWHSLPAHEPVGGLNRLGRVVYQEVSRYRHARNGTARAEPRGFCLDLSGASCPAGGAGGAIPEAATAPSPAPSPSPSPRTPRRPAEPPQAPSPEPERAPAAPSSDPAAPQADPAPATPPQDEAAPPGDEA